MVVCKHIAGMVVLLLGALLWVSSAQESGVQNTRTLIHRNQPTYPEIAKRVSLSGTVVLKAAIAGDGHVKSASVISGNPILAQAAITAVKQWVFAPGESDSVVINISFKLPQ